jgi:hypothetical protein
LFSAFEALQEAPGESAFGTSHYASWRWQVTSFISRPKLQKAISIAVAVGMTVLALGAGSRSLAQTSADSPSDPPTQPSASAISAADLANLVAPIALYPDALLAQVLVACTYPLEVVEAQQWLQQNSALPNRELLAAAQQQNWDPSVQALVAFPGVLARLNENIRWTTDLGNAFLAQQSDVMSAIQTLRAQARKSGQLASTPQLSVKTEVQGDRSAIEIQPANPQIIYVPSYNPSVVWGAPAEGSYPALPYAGSGFGSLFSAVANLAGFLPGFQGLLGLKSWGWALSWLAQALFVNNSFFSDFGFHNSGGGYGDSSLWVHNADHRLGVPYGNSTVASRYGRGSRPLGDGWRTFGSGTRGISASGSRKPLAPRPSTGGQSSMRDHRTDSRTQTPGNRRTFSSNTRTPSTGQSARTSSQPSQTPSRGIQPNHTTGRDSYVANSASNRARSFPGERSFSSSRSSASSHDRFAKPGSAPTGTRSSTRSSEPSRTAKSSSKLHLPHFSKAHMSSHGDSSRHGFSQHAPKPKHFSAPKFKAPHAPKSHGGGHASRGHSGSKSHRG